MPPTNNPWKNRVRRLMFFASTVTSFYILASYLLDRAREARLRALKEKKERDLLKNHFMSLISTISFTLYALLPTLHPQLTDEYPVENTSQALQNLSAPASTAEPTPDHSMVLPQPSADVPPSSETSTDQEQKDSDGHGNVAESWTSEFQTESVAESEDPSLIGSSMVQGHEDDAFSSTTSQSISLPPTDTSSFSPSPPSDQSHLQSSPTQPPIQDMQPHVPVDPRSKKELWRDLKIQTLTRSLTTAYLIPLLYLLTSSQLSTLARVRYLADIESTLPQNDPDNARHEKRTGLFGYFSTDAMGLTDFVEAHTPSILNPRQYVPNIVSQYLPFGRSVTVSSSLEEPSAMAARKQLEAVQRDEDERVYLTYSWWILHEGWRSVAKRVENAVEEVFGGMGLKRDLAIADWESFIREVRARVETQSNGETAVLYSFVPYILPTYPMPETTSGDPNPLPQSPPTDRLHLMSLLQQTESHLASADGTYLIEKGVSAMIRKMLESLREDAYSGSEIGLILGEPQAVNTTRRLVDCLPAVDRWGKGVWEGIPDSGIENMTAIPEFEGFAALVFGDWAPRD